MTVPLGRTRTLGALARIRDLGSTAQASVPGAYAWCVTVAPVAFARAAPSSARVAATCGIGLLACAPALEGTRPKTARLISVWGLVSTSLLVWIVAPASSVSPMSVDVVGGLAGMLGWALFALASAAPALAFPLSGSPVPTSFRVLRSKTPADRGDAILLWIGFAMAGVTQAVGWRVAEPERAVLVRLLGLAGGLAAVGAADAIVAARHTARKVDAPRRRTKKAIVPLILFGLLGGGGVVVALTHSR